ncbi:hypothetical protein [Actinomycetospora straminea]|uniref:Uncharacterized protein n=1 Tax=Actinomycetospora straminea TaxID=663607 RepID=A0ABP9EZI1_9PSEU|nr:hypothetical protein [Actinomycetospora straminea]MDD7931837.1 hypothetical protein [Actinomycetospora straminea]
MTRRERTASGGPTRYVLTALGVFLFALLVVTGTELVIGHPLSGGLDGQTSMSTLFVTPGD